MLLKREYEKNEDGSLKTAKDGKPLVRGVNILRGAKRHHFSPALVAGGIGEGWLVRTRESITIRTLDGDAVEYKVEREPGFYCCHCGEPVGDRHGGTIHVTNEHPDEKSPDPSNPLGFEKINFYDCALVVS